MDISYKHGWRIEIRYLDDDMVVVRMAVAVTDVMTGEPTTLNSVRYYPSSLDMQGFIVAIYNQILETERHEASEWFKVNGIAVFNEHDSVEEQRHHLLEAALAPKGGSHDAK